MFKLSFNHMQECTFEPGIVGVARCDDSQEQLRSQDVGDLSYEDSRCFRPLSSS